MGACADHPGLPPDEDQIATGGARAYVLPGVTGTACRTNYISDGAGGCIYAPPSEPTTGGSSGTGPASGNTGTTGTGTKGTTGESAGGCDPRVDPECEQPLTAADTAMIRAVLREFVRPDTAIADTTARRQCGEMRRQFESTLAAGLVFRGKTDNPTSSAHYGATYNGRIHMDPWLLDSAIAGSASMRREVANTALHEAAHVLGRQHPAGATPVGGYDAYTDPYFSLLSPGPNTCLRF